MSDVDLTEAVEAAARAAWERQTDLPPAMSDWPVQLDCRRRANADGRCDQHPRERDGDWSWVKIKPPSEAHTEPEEQP